MYKKKIQYPNMILYTIVLLVYFRFIKNSADTEEEYQQESLVLQDLNEIKSMEKEEFLKKTDEEKHAIAILIEKEYHPFGKLFKDDDFLTSEYFFKIYKLYSEQSVNDYLDEAFDELDASEEKLTSNNVTLDSQTSPINVRNDLDSTDEVDQRLTTNDLDTETHPSSSVYIPKLEYSDELYFDLFQKDIQIHHFNFVKFLSEKTTLQEKFHELFFIIFFRECQDKKISGIENILDKPESSFYNQKYIEEYLMIDMKTLDAVQQEVKRFKRIIDGELKSHDSFLRAVLKNEQLKERVISVGFSKKSIFYHTLANSSNENYLVTFEKISKSERLKSSFINIIKIKLPNEYRYFYVFNDSDLKESISRKLNETDSSKRIFYRRNI